MLTRVRQQPRQEASPDVILSRNMGAIEALTEEFRQALIDGVRRMDFSVARVRVTINPRGLDEVELPDGTRRKLQ